MASVGFAQGKKLDRQISPVEQGEPRYGGTLRFRGPGGADRLDTASAYYATSGQVLRALTRQLFAYPASHDLSDPELSFEPAADIAVEIPTRDNGGVSADGTIYTIRLRSDVFWDTEPQRQVVAQDFIRGLKRLANPVAGCGALHYFTSTIEGMWEYCMAYDEAFQSQAPTAESMANFQNSHEISGLSAPDPETLVIRLKQPANDFLNILAMGFASAAPEEYDQFIPDSEEFRRNMRSNGPYRLTHYEAGGKKMRMERNPAWIPESDQIRGQYVDTIEVAVAKESADVLLKKLDDGEADLAWSFTAVSWAKPSPAREGFPRSYPGFALNPYLVFNMRSPNQGGAMANRKVRQAVAYAVDKTAISEILSVLEGVPNHPLHSIIPPGSVGHREFNLYPSQDDRGDKAKARKLLVEAGYGDGLRLVAAVRAAELHLNVMRSVAADLQEIGIELKFETYSQAEYYGTLLTDPANAEAGVWDIAEPGWTPDWWGNNGRTLAQPMFQTNRRKGTTNFGGYSNPAVDQLMLQALETADAEESADLWHEVDKSIMADVAIVPLLAFAAMTSRYHSPRVRNAIHVPQIEFFDITNLWLDVPG